MIIWILRLSMQGITMWKGKNVVFALCMKATMNLRGRIIVKVKRILENF